MKPKPILAMLMAVLTVLSAVPVSSALDPTASVRTLEANPCFSYCENGVWHDLDLPVYELSVEGVNKWAYALSLDGTDPDSSAYTAKPLSAVLSASAKKGVESILLNGYPGVFPDLDVLSVSDAVYGTQAAILCYLCELGASGIPSWLNRRVNSSALRASPGKEAVLTYADLLVAKARSGVYPAPGITAAPQELTLTRGADRNFSGSFDIWISDLTSYSVSSSGMPSSITLSGVVNTADCTVTVSAPSATAGTDFTVTLTGYDARDASNLTAFEPAAGGLKTLVYNENSQHALCSTTLNVSVPGTGRIQIFETDEDGSGVAGSVWGVYSDRVCSDLLSSVTLQRNGSALSSAYDAGTELYVRQISSPQPYLQNTEIHPVKIVSGAYVPVRVTAKKASGTIRILHEGERVSSLNESSTAYGRLYAPVRSRSGIPGSVFLISTEDGTEIDRLTTGSDGKASLSGLPLGTYTVTPVSMADGTVPSAEPAEVTFVYPENGSSALEADLTFTDDMSFGTVSMKKQTEAYDRDARTFYPVDGSGFVYGLFSARANGLIPPDALVSLLTTDSGGTAVSTPLPFGDYYFRELAVPDETVSMSRESFPFTLRTGSDMTYSDTPFFNDMHKGTVSVYLTDSVSGEPVAGAVFEVLGKTDGFVYSDFETDETGCGVSCRLPVGNYILKMRSPAPGYILSGEEHPVTISTEVKTSIVFEVETSSNRVVLSKSEQGTEHPLADAQLSVWNPDGTLFRTVRTNADGTAVLEAVPAGKYTWSESAAPAGYALRERLETFEIAPDGTVSGTTSISDEPTAVTVTVTDLSTESSMGGLTLILKNAEGTVLRTRETEAGYRIPAEDASASDTFLSSAEAAVSIRYLPAGNYILEESVPDGYLSNAPIPFTVSENSSVSSPVRVLVTNVPTGLKIKKVDAANNLPLAGAGFSVKTRNGLASYTALTFTRRQDGTYAADPSGRETTLMVSGTGELMITGLPQGSIWIEETVTPEGYFPISSIRVDLDAECTSLNPYVLTVQNSKFIKLGMDSDWWEFPALCLGILLLGAGTAFFVIRRRKKKRKVTLPC